MTIPDDKNYRCQIKSVGYIGFTSFKHTSLKFSNPKSLNKPLKLYLCTAILQDFFSPYPNFCS